MKKTFIGIFLLAALLQGCSSLGVVDSPGVQDNRSSIQKAEEKTKRMAFIPLVFGEHSKEIGKIDDRIMMASGNVFATPTYILTESGQQIIFSGEGNLLDNIFNEVTTTTEQ